MLSNKLVSTEETPIRLHHRQDARQFIKMMKQAGRHVVIVTGCFDLLHMGHVKFLKQAKSSGDALVVGIEDDDRVCAFKGIFRPINSILQRVEVMEALTFVDFVFIISGSPNADLKMFYKRLHKYLGADALAITEGDPDVQAKKEQIEAAGGELITTCSLVNASTTSIIQQFLRETNLPTQFIRKGAMTKVHKADNAAYWEQLELSIDFHESDGSNTTERADRSKTV